MTPNIITQATSRNALGLTQGLLTLIVVIILLGTNCHGAEFDELDSRIALCETVLKDSLEMPDSRIPKDLLQRCRGVAIFPKVWNVGALLGVSFGSGVVMRRNEKTGAWSYPAFFNIRQGSLGVQMGAQSIDLILLMMSEKTIQKLLEEKLTLGIDASVSAGPLGRDASAETNWTMESGIISYSRSKGLFMGFALSGSILEPDKISNQNYHGQGVSVQDTLYESKGSFSESAKNLSKTLTDSIK